ncbi:hypothetical protein BSNK01_07610 [Bacillaceae bacterium]
MYKRFRFWLSLFAILVCLFNFSGLDRDNLLLTFVSIPVWLIELVADFHTVNPFLVYLLTIASWYLLGWWIDRLIERRAAASAE